MNWRHWFIVLGAILANSACLNPYRKQCSKWVPLFHHPSKEWDERFSEHDVETQYEIYTCAMNYVHPPLMGFSERLARNGARAVPTLRAKLNRATHELEVSNIILVFSGMQIRGHYDVASDDGLMRDIEASTQRVVLSSQKGLVLENIERITHTPFQKVAKPDVPEGGVSPSLQ